MIDEPYNGPSPSGNGGWTSGLIAEAVSPNAPCTVKLLAPPPLAQELSVCNADDGFVVVTASGDSIATAHVPDFGPDVPDLPAVSLTEARETSPRYKGHDGNPFPNCYVCGMNRHDETAMRLTPGPLTTDSDITACVWTPPAQPTIPHVWAALDCPGGWASDISQTPRVLGTMTAHAVRMPQAGEPCVLMGRCVERTERTAATVSTAWQGDTLIGWSRAVWVRVKPELLFALEGR